MKKSFALILCLVFVISIALVTCVAFIPMNVTQVASAAVNQFTGGDLYTVTYYNYQMGLNALPETVFTSYIDCYGVVVPNGSSFSYDVDDMLHFVYLEKVLVSGALGNRFQLRQSDSQLTIGDWRFVWSSSYNMLQFFVYNGSSWDSYVGDAGITVYFGSSFDDWASDSEYIDAIITCFNQILTVNMINFFPLPSDAPIIDEDSHALLNIAYFYNYINNQYVSVANLQLDAILVHNAVDHYVIDLNNGVIGVPVDITYNKSVGGVSSVVEQSIILSQVENGVDNDVTDDLFYLCLCIPAGVVSIDVKFADGTDVLTIDDTSDTYTAFRDNFSALSDTSIDGTYQQGYNAGLEVGAEQADGNNLLSVIWAVFEMPFKLLFGQYDTDANSSTYQQYVGGLFNFYLLGIDLRPFMLSIMSVCIVIGIFRIILGVRGLK